MDELSTKQGRAMIRRLFHYPEGPLVLQWLKVLYQDYKFQPIVQCANPNAALALAYQAGKSDLVTELTVIAESGFAEDKQEGNNAGSEFSGIEFESEPESEPESGEVSND